MITTSQDITTWLGIPSMDSLATVCQQLAEQHVKDFLAITEIEQQTWTEYYPVSQESGVIASDPMYVLSADRTMAVPALYLDPNVIQLRNTPVRSITNVWEDFTGYYGQGPNAFSGNPLTSGTDFYLKCERDGISFSGSLVRRSIWWMAAPGSVKVQYVAGFTPQELSGRYSGFKTAVLDTAADLYMRGKALSMGHRSEITSESDGDGVNVAYYQARLRGVEIPDSAADALAPYEYYGDVF